MGNGCVGCTRQLEVFPSIYNSGGNGQFYAKSPNINLCDKMQNFGMLKLSQDLLD